MNKHSHKMFSVITILALMLMALPTQSAQADNTAQSLPFSQDWSDTGLIAANDDWSSVPGIIGYLGDDPSTTVAGTDPQTILVPFTTQDVIANQTSTAIINGGVAEFHITDPVVALQGSGTADAPHIVLHLNTTGQSNIIVSYNLRDIDGSADNAVQPVALQYRVGSSGNFTNIPAGFVADATTGPSLATLVTPVSVQLPVAAENQSEVQVRIITYNAGGSDEWVGIDDINVSTNVGDIAPTVSSTTPSNGATNVAVNSNIDITFSEAVNASGNWFTISCGASGAHTAAASGGPTTFTLDPDVDFANSETCTITVVAAQVTDQDTDDPPDAMEANYVFSFTTFTPLPPSPVIINEVDSDTPGTDAAEFVELYDGGAGNTDLSGLVVVFYNGSNDLSYAAFDLDGFSTDANGYFLLGNSGVSPAPSIIFSGNLLQNGADAVALYQGDAANFPNNTPITTTNLVDALVYDTADADDAGLLILLNPGQPQVDESGGGASDSQSNQRCANGSGGARNTTTYTQEAPTPGSENCPPPPPEMCGDPATLISAVQGSGASSPLVGTQVSIEGIVVGDFQNNATPDNGDLNGFYVQEEDAEVDADPLTSEGLFVFAPSSIDVSVGEHVRVHGTVAEGFGRTELGSVSTVLSCSTGNALPTAATVNFPVTNISDFERYEGMRVAFPQALVISEYFNYERFGEIVLALPLPGESRPFTGTAIDEPGPAANARTLANSLRRITLDDGLSSQNPDVLRHPNGDAFTLDNRFRGGDTVQNASGVMDFAFGLYRIQPTAPADYTEVNPRPAAPEEVGGTLRVAAMNTLNFFLTPDNIQEPSNAPDDPADNLCGPVPSLECRGWDGDQPLELGRQRDKLLAALAGLESDIIGLNELENTTGVDPLGDPTNGIVTGLNAMLGAGTYDYIDTDVIGTDAIRVGLIYKPASVVPVGNFELLTSADDPRFIDTLNRPALAQTFEELATGARFTVVVNHLKSKGSACPGDPDIGDGQGNCNQTRLAAAQALVDWLATDPTGSGDPDFLIIGDLNSYAQEDPIDAIKAGPDDTLGTDDDYTNLIAQYIGTYAYSFVFDGQFGYLDHALSNSSLTPQVTGATEWHINSDEPDLLDYDTSFKPPAQEAIYESDAYRASDHDPVIVGLGLDINTVCNGLEATIVGTPGDDVIDGTNGNDVIVGLGGNDIINGGNGDDVICGNAGNDSLNGGNGNDTLLGSFGDDTLDGSNGNDSLDGGANNDVLVGNNGDDTLTGGSGGDFFSGGVGLDTNTDFKIEEGDMTDGT